MEVVELAAAKRRAAPTPDLVIAKPDARLRSCVVAPARNEEATLASLVESLADQRDLTGARLEADSYEVILLLNNCTDRTASVARSLQRKHPRLRLHLAEINFAAHEAHVGQARRVLFEVAFSRFQSLRRATGLILTTDADSRPSTDWIAQNATEIVAGVDAVGGRILLEPGELAALSPGVRRLFLLDIGYRRALEEMRSLYAPEMHDPFPRHHQHFGSSLAVTASAYQRAGGMPLRRSREDVALYRAILDSGGRFRHSEKVRVHTSARMIGRAEDGLADAIGWWNLQVRSAAPVRVECATAAEARLRELGLWCLRHPGSAAPAALMNTPDEPKPVRAADIETTLAALRTRIEALCPLTLSERLEPQCKEEQTVGETEMAA